MFKARCVILVLVILATSGLFQRSSPADESPDRRADGARMERLSFIKRSFAEFELTADGSGLLAASEVPVLRYSNPVRNFFSDGATFLWLDGKQPVAAGTISIRGAGDVWWEFSSFSHRPLRCVREGRAVWTPESGNLVRQPLSDAPDPASSSKVRLLQMRQLARRFSVTMLESEEQRDETSRLRLLPNPVYDWSDEAAGGGGALFAFSETTDPEALLLLEFVDETATGTPVWRFSLARMTSRPLIFRFDDREVLSLKGYWANPRAQADPYRAGRLGNYEPPSSR